MANELPWVVLACLVAGALVIGLRLGSWFRRRALAESGRFHNLRGQRGEKKAERLLKKLGYRVRGRQVIGSYEVMVDGVLERIQLSADLLVERDGTELVAEVKTGAQAPRVTYAETRRQMLEYQLAFKVPGVLLVDADESVVREVRFPLEGAQAPRRRSTAGWWLTLLGLLAASAWFLRR